MRITKNWIEDEDPSSDGRKVSGYFDIDGQAGSIIPDILEPSGTTQTVDWDDGNSQIIELNSATGDVTLTLNNGRSGGSYLIKFIQGATDRQLTWPGTVKWEGGSAPTLTIVEDSEDVVSLWFDGTNYHGSYLLDLS